MTILKSFRIEEELIRFLEKSAKERGVSQSSIIEEALIQLADSKTQWEKDLESIANDKQYRKEQEELAEEYYGD